MLAVAASLVVAGCVRNGEQTTTTSTTLPPETATTTTIPSVLTGAGIEGGTIILGVLLPLSGSLESLGRSMLAGQQVYWAFVNDTMGGVGGRFPVDLREVDTAYDEETARAALLQKDPVLAVASVLGSEITATLAAEVAGTDTLVAAGSLASGWGASPNLVLDLALPSYRDQIAGIIKASRLPEPPLTLAGPFGLLYQEGVHGEDCLAGFDEATAGSTDMVRIAYPAGTTEFGSRLDTLREAGVATLFVCSTSQALLRIMATLDLLDYRPLTVATSHSYDSSLPAALGQGREDVGLELLSNLRLVGSIPPYESDAPGVKLLRDGLQRYGAGDAEVDQWFFFGYTQAATLHVILEDAFDGGDLTPRGLRDARNRLGEIDLGFGPGSAHFDEQGVPVMADVVSIPATGSRFGLQPLGSYYPTR